jgi:hypothetical protein
MTDKMSYQGESATAQIFDTEGVRREDCALHSVLGVTLGPIFSECFLPFVNKWHGWRQLN